MQIIQGTDEFKTEEKSAVAIGKFDGIHLGHQKLLSYILEQKEQGYQAAVFTFDPPPSVFFGNKGTKELMTREEKRMAFQRMGVDLLVEFPLNEHTAAILPEDFIERILVGQLHARYIVAGTDVSFGDKGAGNCMLLSSMSASYGYEVRIIDKICFGGREVSSTYVKEEVEKGHMEEAAALLGAPYSVSGEIIRGKQFGRTIGMPTVNLLPPDEKLLPPNGVYYSEVLIRGKRYRGITNIGYKPTVSEDRKTGVETYIYHFGQDIYGEKITVELLSFKRKEQKFGSRTALKEQMERDLRDGKAFHEELGRLTGKVTGSGK